MSRTVQTGIVITGRNESGSRAIVQTQRELEKLERAAEKAFSAEWDRRIRVQANAQKELARQTQSLDQRIRAALGPMGQSLDVFGKMTPAVVGAGIALKAFADILDNVDTSMEALADGVSTMERLALASKGTEAVKTSLPIARQVAQTMVFINDLVTGRSVREAELDQRIAARAAKEKALAAEFERIDAEAKAAQEQENAGEERRIKNAERLSSMRKKGHEAYMRQLEEAGEWEMRVRQRGEEIARRGMEEKSRKEKEEHEAKIARQFALYDLEAQIDAGLTDIAMSNMQRRADLRMAEETAMIASLEKQKALGQQMGQVLGSAIKDLVTGAAPAEEIFKRMAIQMAQMAVQALIVGAIMNAIGGFGGGLLGGVVGGIFGFKKGGIVPDPQRFSSGGMVRGGTPGRDSVPALLEPGELVFSRKATDMLLSLLSGPVNPSRGMSSGGLVPAAAAAAGPSVVVQQFFKPATTPTDADVLRSGRELLKTLNELNRRGYRAG